MKTRILTGVVAIPILVVLLLVSYYTSLYMVCVIAFISCIELHKAFKDNHWGYLVQLGVLLGLATLVFLRRQEQGRILILLPFIVAFITDAGAYFVGVFLGKRHIFPVISPKKTLEGCIGGVVIGLAATIAYGYIVRALFPDFVLSITQLAVIGLCGAVATEAGDLLFSWIKRKLQIKDYGNLLPGHGGMLDRFDSMVLVAPVIFLLITCLPKF